MREVGGLSFIDFGRLVFGVTSCHFLLNGTIKHRLALCEPSDNLNRLKDDLHVDDIVTGCTTVEEGIRFMKKQVLSCQTRDLSYENGRPIP